jgi:hypothetical protein
MRSRLTALAAASALAVMTAQADAQSLPSPAFYYGFTPTPGQWNSYFEGKADYPGILTYANMWTVAQKFGQVTVGGTVTLNGNIGVTGTLTSPSIVPLVPQFDFIVGNSSGIGVVTPLAGDCVYGSAGVSCPRSVGVNFAAIATVMSASNLLSGTLSAGRLPAFSGDAASGSGSAAMTIQALAVTGAKIAGATIQGTNFVSNTLPFSNLSQDPTANSILCNSGTATATLQYCTTAPSAAIPQINLAVSGNGGVFGNLSVSHFNGGAAAGAQTWWRGDTTWASPPGSMILLNTVSGSGASLADTTSLTSGSYSAYEIILINVLPTTNAVNPQLQVHTGGTGGVFQNANYQDALVRANSAGVSPGGGLAASIELGVSQSSGTATPGISGRITVANVTDPSNFKTFYGTLGYFSSAGVPETSAPMGYWGGGGSSIDGFQINFSSGNVASGTMKIYGIP